MIRCKNGELLTEQEYQERYMKMRALVEMEHALRWAANPHTPIADVARPPFDYRA